VERVNWHEAAAYCNAVSTSAGRPLCYSCSGSGSETDCLPSASYATPYDCPGYRLPTEAEWEYAARAGDTRATYNGDLAADLSLCEEPNAVLDPIAWFCGNSGGMSHAVGTRTANAWGLYDMLGNVWEFCHDWWDTAGYPPGAATDPWGPPVGYYRVIRGGSWANDDGAARAASRFLGDRVDHSELDGFRPVRTLP
jgi:formylglycine-generating enzyme required for sulfatase activity